MKRESGYVVWPPVWAKIGENNPPIGEIGYLENVLKSEVCVETLFLLITYQNSKFMGALTFDDPVFCSQLYELLKSKIGFSIKEIGDLNLSHLL